MLKKKPEKKPKRLQKMRESFSSAKGSISSFTSVKVMSPSLASASKKHKPTSPASTMPPVPTEAAATVEIEAGCVSQEGPYHENEDRMCFGTNLNSQIDCFVGVFDGHGGTDCATFVSGNLDGYLTKTFNSTEDWTTGDEKMKDMFHEIEDEYVKIAVEEDDTSGACATVVIVKGFEAMVANIGDCKAVAVPDVTDAQSFVVLTGDHRADAPEEEDRIERAGGSVVDGRVGNLQPSRSFGDIDVKEIVGDGVVIPTPEVSRVRVQVGGFMVVATDGLWDYVDTETCVEIAKAVLLDTNYDAEAAAEELVNLAVERRALDDVTVSLIVWKKSEEEAAGESAAVASKDL